MAIYHQDIADIELNSGSILRTFLKRSIGLADAAANRFGVRVFRDGEPETLSGVTCQGFFKNADGVNIALTSYGTIDGNVAYVTLPAACYNVEGRFTLAIKLVGSDVTGTMRIVDGNVDNTNTSSPVAPTGSVPTYQEVLSVFEQMQAALDEYDAKVAEQDAQIVSLKSAFDSIQGAAPEFTEIYYESGGINSNGNNVPDNTARIRNGLRALIPINSGDAVYCDSYYKIRVAVYSANLIYGSNLVAWINTFDNGLIAIPEEYAGQYAAILIEKVGSEEADISGDIATIQQHIKYLSYAKAFDGIDEYHDLMFEPGNNVMPLPAYRNVDSGVTIEIKNGIFKISGTTTSVVRLKVTNGFEWVTSAPASWGTETVSLFTIGETYSLHNVVLSGVLPSDVGVSLRSSSATIISASKPEATIEETPAYAMLYIPKSKTINVEFIPMFIHGAIDDAAYIRKLSNNVLVDNVNDNHYIMPDLSADFIYNATLESAMKFPASYAVTGKPTPMIILAHGLSSTISSSSWGNSSMETLVGSFAGDGFAVLDVNQVTAGDWCNPDLIAKYAAAIKYAVTAYNVVPAFVFGESMGSLIGLRLSTMFATVKACVISGIRLDLAARYALASDAQKAIIDANLGFTDGYDADIASGWDVTAISAVTDNNAKICPVNFPPTFFIYGTSDTTTKTESLAKIAEIKRGGTIVKSAEYTGDHTAVCYLQAGTSYADAVAWFNQWA